MSIVNVVWHSYSFVVFVVFVAVIVVVICCCCFYYFPASRNVQHCICSWLQPPHLASPCLTLPRPDSCSSSPGLAAAAEDHATSSCHLTCCQAPTEHTPTLPTLLRPTYAHARWAAWDRWQSCGSSAEIKMHHTKTEIKTNEKWFLLMRKLLHSQHPQPGCALRLIAVGWTLSATARWKQIAFALKA